MIAHHRFRIILPVVSFTLAYLLIASFLAWRSGNAEFLFYIIVVLVLGIVTVIVDGYVELSHGVLWCLSAWGMLHLVGGLVPVMPGWTFDGTKAVIYSWWIIPGYLKYDQIVHAFGFGVATWMCWQAVHPTLIHYEPKASILALCALAGLGLGALNEIVEFVAVLTISETNVGGYMNTGWDLVANLVGSVIAVLFILIGFQLRER